jgi:hypothetical protein
MHGPGRLTSSIGRGRLLLLLPLLLAAGTGCTCSLVRERGDSGVTEKIVIATRKPTGATAGRYEVPEAPAAPPGLTRMVALHRLVAGPAPCDGSTSAPEPSTFAHVGSEQVAACGPTAAADLPAPTVTELRDPPVIVGADEGESSGGVVPAGATSPSRPTQPPEPPNPKPGTAP